jgi:recombinational DNA repair protein (RecF pathway)
MSAYGYTPKNLPLMWTGTGVGHPIEFPRCSHCGVSAPHHYMRTAGRAYCFDCVARAIELLEKTP